eukprot:16434606-Heterocapsa_arctica.AAC.1
MEIAATGPARRTRADSVHTSVASEIIADSSQAIRSLTTIIAGFEARGEKLSIRDMTSSKCDMEKILPRASPSRSSASAARRDELPLLICPRYPLVRSDDRTPSK